MASPSNANFKGLSLAVQWGSKIFHPILAIQDLPVQLVIDVGGTQWVWRGDSQILYRR